MESIVDREKALGLADRLAVSQEPSLRYKIRVNFRKEDPDSGAIRELQAEVKNSPLVLTLLGADHPDQTESQFQRIYKKWAGPHWILASLADLGYPPGDPNLKPLRDQVLDGWLDPFYKKSVYFDSTPSYARMKVGVPVIQGRARRCASQQGNALYSSLKLGFVDERCHQLAELLLSWQWPDGGWNCDKKAEAVHSSFWESALPLQGLALYSRITGDQKAAAAVERAAEVFLRRNLFLRASDGGVMNKQFIQLRYPNYWRYNILVGLGIMAEAGCLQDPRCREALDLLESKQLADGGWPAEDRFYQTTQPDLSGYSNVDWGGVNRRRMNSWVSVDALAVLRNAGRI